MSTINSRKQIGHGVGGGNACIDNVVICSPGMWAGWIDDDQAFIANGADNWVCSIYDQRTGKVRRAIEDPNDPQYAAGMNTGYAGGELWAAWLAGTGNQRGLFDATGVHLHDAGLMGVGPNGELGYKPLYQSLGPTMCIESTGQPEWQITAGSAVDLQLLGHRQACWQERNRICVTPNMPQPLQYGDAFRPAAHLINGRWWVSYYSTLAGIILHPFDELVGYTVVPAGVNCWHNARSFGDKVFFALSTSEAEQAGQLRGEEIDTTLPRHKFEADITIPKLTGPYLVGWFEFAPDNATPGNCVVAVRGLKEPAVQQVPTVVADETADLITGNVIAHFIGGGSVEEIEARARSLKHRPLAYWDSNKWPRWPNLPKGSWTCIRAYRNKNVSLEAFEAELRDNIQTAPGTDRSLVLIPQQYSSNSDLVGYFNTNTPGPYDSTELKRLIPIFLRAAQDFPKRVLGLLLFSGYGRPGGLQDHPDLFLLWDKVMTYVTLPTIEKYPATVTPPSPPSPQPKPTPTPTPVPVTQQGDIMLIDPAAALLYVTKVLNHTTRPGLCTLLNVNKRVISIQPDGSVKDRDPGTDGGYETCQISGNLATFRPDDSKPPFTFGFVLVDKL